MNPLLQFSFEILWTMSLDNPLVEILNLQFSFEILNDHTVLAAVDTVGLFNPSIPLWDPQRGRREFIKRFIEWLFLQFSSEILSWRNGWGTEGGLNTPSILLWDPLREIMDTLSYYVSFPSILLWDPRIRGLGSVYVNGNVVLQFSSEILLHYSKKYRHNVPPITFNSPLRSSYQTEFYRFIELIAEEPSILLWDPL